MKIRIKEFRLKKNLTQIGMANELQCSQNLISRMESGTSDPKASFLLQIADHFHVSVDYLLYHSEIQYTADFITSLDSQSQRYYNYYLRFQELTPENQETINILMERLKKSQDMAKHEARGSQE